MERGVPASDSMSSFEHVELADGGSTEPAAAPKQPVQTADAGEAGHSPTAAQAAAAPAATEAPPSARPPAPPAEDAPSPPPATQALASVLGFFGAGGSSSGSPAAQQPEKSPPATPAPAAGQGTAQQQGKQGEGEEEYDAVAAFEQEAIEAADKVAQAAEEVGQKLLHGAAEAKESLTSLAQGITSWWANLDPTRPSSGESDASGIGMGIGSGGRQRSSSAAAAAADAAAAAEQLGLEPGESVLESFACQLWQTYTATNNFFTPLRQVPFPGILHVTSQRLCFAFEDRGVAPIKLPGKAIKGVAKKAADAQQGLPERIELALEGKGQSLVLADFPMRELEMDSALALLEHLAEEGSEQ